MAALGSLGGLVVCAIFIASPAARGWAVGVIMDQAERRSEPLRESIEDTFKAEELVFMVPRKDVKEVRAALRREGHTAVRLDGPRPHLQVDTIGTHVADRVEQLVLQESPGARLLQRRVAGATTPDPRRCRPRLKHNA